MAAPTEQALTTTVLLGAGASIEAGVPAAVQMTEAIVRWIDNDHAGRDVAGPLNFVLARMVAHDAARGGSAYASVDVERLFSAVELLAERDELELAPFVASWEPALRAFDVPAHSPFWARQFSQALVSTHGEYEIPKLLTEFVRAEVGIGSGRIFGELRTRMLMALQQVTQVTRPVDYLAPLLRLSERQGCVSIATLNYDLTIETLTKSLGTPCDTGILGWSTDGAWSWSDRGVRLLKLHGSIDWRFETRRAAVEPNGELPQDHVVQTDDPTEDRRPPALVFGQRGKLTGPGPFMELLSQFALELERSANLLVVGYSFRDAHVNEAIRRWLNNDRRRTLTVIDPAFPSGRRYAENDFRQDLLNHLAPLDTPTKAQPMFDPRITVVREVASTALAEMLSG